MTEIEQDPAAPLRRLREYWPQLESHFSQLVRDLGRCELVNDVSPIESGSVTFSAFGRSVRVTLTASVVPGAFTALGHIICAVEKPLYRATPVPFLQFQIDPGGSVVEGQSNGRSVNLTRGGGELVAEWIVMEAVKAPLA